MKCQKCGIEIDKSEEYYVPKYARDINNNGLFALFLWLLGKRPQYSDLIYLFCKKCAIKKITWYFSSIIIIALAMSLLLISGPQHFVSHVFLCYSFLLLLIIKDFILYTIGKKMREAQESEQ